MFMWLHFPTLTNLKNKKSFKTQVLFVFKNKISVMLGDLETVLYRVLLLLTLRAFDHYQQ